MASCRGRLRRASFGSKGLENRVKSAKGLILRVDRGGILIQRIERILELVRTRANKGCLGDIWRLRCYKMGCQAAEANTLDVVRGAVGSGAWGDGDC